MKTKIGVLLIHDTKETAVFTDMNQAFKYIHHWFLSRDATSILIQSGAYKHDELGVISFTQQDLDPTVYGYNPID